MWLVCVLHLCNLTAFKSNMMLVSLYAADLHAGPVATGTLFATYAVAPIVLGVHAGRLSDAIGMRVPMLIGSAGMIAALVLPSLYAGLSTLFVSATLLGAAYVFYHVSIQNMVGAISTPDTRARNFANFSLIASVPYFIGPAATGLLIERGGYAAAYVCLAALPVAALLVLAVAGRAIPRTRAPAVKDAPAGVADLLRNRPLVCMAATSGLALTSVDLFQFYAPMHAHAVGLSPSTTGIVLSLYAVAAVAVRLAMARLVGWAGSEERLLAAALGLGTLAYLLFPLFSSAPLLGAAAFLLGAGLGCAQPLSMMLTYNYAPPGRSGEGLGLRLTVNNLAHAALPFGLGFVTSAFGLVSVFAANAAILAGGAALTGRNSLPKPDVEERCASLSTSRP
jgi:MFS family permease